MGREASFTYEQVAAVANAVKLSGSKPTSRGIRERRGNVGSMGTINKMLQRWRASQDIVSAPPLALPLPLQRVLLEFIEHEVASVRSTLEAELVEHQHEMADLASESERQADIIQSCEADLQRLAEVKAAAEGRAGQLGDELNAARRDAALERSAFEALRTSLARAELRMERIPEIEAELSEMRIALSNERQLRSAAEKAAAVALAQKIDQDERILDLWIKYVRSPTKS